MKIVNIFGGPGTGKSTLAAFLFANLKARRKFSAELITEFAKDLVYEGNRDSLKNDQLYVFANQNHKIKSIQNYTPNIDLVITDSPLILSNIYGNINNSIDKNFEKFVLSTFNSYENINIFLNRNNYFKYDKSGRLQDEHDAEKIHNLIKKYLDDNKIKYHEFNIMDGLMVADTKFREILKLELGE